MHLGPPRMKSPFRLLQRARATVTGGSWPFSRARAGLGSMFLARLPIELQLLVLENLDPEDVYNALNSSKTLRYLWLSEDIWPWLAEMWYPGLFQTVQVKAAQQDPTTVDPRQESQYAAQHAMGQIAPSELFRRMLGQLSRRNSGKFASALHHNMRVTGDTIFALSKNVPLDQGGLHSTDDAGNDLLKNTSASISRFMVYRSGRIAWWPDPYGAPFLAVVDDFKTASRRIYRFPNHENIQQGYRTAMSDHLLVIARDNVLHAWHLEQDQLASIVVPERLERCIADGTTVLVVSRTAQLYSWKFGGPLWWINMNSLECYQPGLVRLRGLNQLISNQFLSPRRQGLRLGDNGMLLDFILHPDLEHVLFVVTMLDGDLVIHELDHGMPLQSYPLHSDNPNSVKSWKEVSEYLRWEKCDSYGGYCLFSMYLGQSDDLSPSDLQNPEDPFCTCGRKEGIVSVCFNIHTKAYKVTCHHLLPIHSELGYVTATFHLWDDKLYTSYASPAMESGMPITALRCCTASQKLQKSTPIGQTPVYSTSKRSQGGLARRNRAPLCPERTSSCPNSGAEQEAWQRLIDFGLEVSQNHNKSKNSVNGGALWNWADAGARQVQTIVGDGDFLIYVVDGAYMTWSFSDEIPALKTGTTWTPWKRP